MQKKKLIMLILILSTLAPSLQAQDKWSTFSDDEIVAAIYRTENSVKYPYGIKSINTHGDKEKARKICLNSVRNGRKRWIRAGRPDDLIIHIGRRYSPPAINPNWVRLVKHFLTKGER